MAINKLPPVLYNARVIAYAIVDDSVKYHERGIFFAGDKLLGPVSRLAICQRLEDTEIMVLHCDNEWSSLGEQGGYKSVEEAKTETEKSYCGVNELWINTLVTEAEAKAFLEEKFKDEKCSFCGRWPIHVKKMIASETARICDVCVRKHSILIKGKTGA